MTALTSETVGEAARLSALVPAWRDLYGRVPQASPFASPDWLFPWWQVFRPGPLASVAVWRGGALAAFAPAWREDSEHGRRLLPLGLGLSDHTDVLLDPNDSEAAEALVEAVDALPAWRVWALEDLAEGASGLALPCPPGWTEERAPHAACPMLALAGAAAPEAVLPQRCRRRWRMARHRAARAGGATLEAIEVSTGAAGFLDHLIRLHGARWEAEGQDGLLHEPRVRAFHLEALPLLIERGLARLYLLSLGERVVGAYYGLARGRAAYAYLGGFDPEAAALSPGTLLIGHALTEAHGEGRAAFDFLRGQETYKYAWGAQDRFTTRRLFHRPAP